MAATTQTRTRGPVATTTRDTTLKPRPRRKKAARGRRLKAALAQGR